MNFAYLPIDDILDLDKLFLTSLTYSISMAFWNQKKTNVRQQSLTDPNCQRPNFLQHYYHFVVFYHLMYWKTPSEKTLTVYWKVIEMMCFQTFLLLILLHRFSRIHPISFQYYQTKRLSLPILSLLLPMLICRTNYFYIQCPKTIAKQLVRRLS